MANDIMSYDKEWAEAARAFVAKEPMQSTGQLLSIKGGILRYGDQAMPGNQALVVVLDSVHENTYFDSRYDPDNPTAPTCYAFGSGDAEMAPHPSMAAFPEYFKPQSETCTGCKWNQFGSANTGRGKACQNRRRLAMLPAGLYTPRKGSRDFDVELFEDAQHYESAEAVFIKLPATSVRAYSDYVAQVDAAFHRPPFGVFTRIGVEPHPKWQYTVTFQTVDKLPDILAQVLFKRHGAAAAQLVRSYTPPQEPTAPQNAWRR